MAVVLNIHIVGLVAALAAVGQAPPTEPTPANAPAEVAVEEEKKSGAKELDGLWPSPRLMKLMLERWAEEACEEYGLDAEQRAAVRKQTVDDWTEFLTANRAEFQPLANEFIEMRMELEPPAAERVKDWSNRALPVFEKARDRINQSHDEFRKVLRPMQRPKFEVDALKMSAGMAIAEQKLKQWKQGEVDKDVFWEPLPADREARREERRRRRTEREAAIEAQVAADTPVDQIAIELGRWEKYVADFVAMFRLDDGQRTTALSCLAELKERAVAHRDRRREDIADLERQIESFKGEDRALEDLKKRLAELYGPVDEMFKELKSRLDGIPTTEQRAQAPQDSPEAAATEPAPAATQERPPPG